jgi:hypothetical protein
LTYYIKDENNEPIKYNPDKEVPESWNTTAYIKVDANQVNEENYSQYYIKQVDGSYILATSYSSDLIYYK